MNIDKFIKMGHSHNLFEDAVITNSETTPYLIVCDGCSNSENTHIGSHLLAMSAKIELDTNGYSDNMKDSIIFRARSMADVMGLDYSSLDATLLIAYVSGDKVLIQMHGDGCLYYKENEVKHTYKIQYFENMPYYMSYLLNKNRNKSYELAVKKATERSESPKTLMHWSDTELESTEADVYTQLSLTLNIDSLDYLVLSTDGVESFEVDAGNKLTSVDESLHTFKRFKGDFIQRKMKRVLKEELKNGKQNSDDLGLAGIYFGEI